jgi:hypothetical protein
MSSMLGQRQPQIPPLRYAPVGMTKFRAELPSRLVAEGEKLQIPPLRSG